MASKYSSFAFLLVVAALATFCQAKLSVHHYKKTCPKVESIIKGVLNDTLKTDPGIGAAILRLHFHDCFVEGCDGSVLLDSTPGHPAEKEAPINVALRGFEVVDIIKATLEKECPGVVSCADILAYGARDGVALMGGPSWKVPAGRKDGRLSSASRAPVFLPKSTFNVDELLANFAVKGLNAYDLVALSGGHTVGVAHCASFSSRLFGFNGGQDRTLDASLGATLKQVCPLGTTNTSIFFPIDSTPLTFDTKYFSEVLQGKGLLTSDATLASSPKTRGLVQASKRSKFFFKSFKSSMKKMSLIEIKSSHHGEIRKHCRVVNH